ncbi:MAG: EthD family reductase [Gordonia sp. (in: high G+C Gram-positive bacteria)]
MSFYVTALYNHPADDAAKESFESYYAQTHTPLAKELPNLESLVVFRPAPEADGSPAAYYLIAVLEYASAEACQESFDSTKGREVLADVPKFAFQGVTLVQGPGGRA